MNTDLDIMRGVPAIAGELHMTARQVRYLIEQGTLPIFRLGGRWCARRTALADHFARLEREALKTEKAVA